MLSALTASVTACATAVGVSEEEADTGGRGRDVAVPDTDTSGGGADADVSVVPDVSIAPDGTLPPPDSSEPVPDVRDATLPEVEDTDTTLGTDATDCPASRCVVEGTTCVSGALLICARDVGGCLVDRAEPCANGCTDGATSCDGSDAGTGTDATDTGGTDVLDSGDTAVDAADVADTAPDAAVDTGTDVVPDTAVDTGPGTDTGPDTGPDADTGPDTDAGTDTGTIVPVCGNGTREDPEECDDGNLEVDDGCTSDCMIESAYTCRNNAGYVGCNQSWDFNTQGSNGWGGYACSSIAYNLHELIFYFISPVDGPVTVATSGVNGGLTPDWDLVVLDASASSECGPAVTCVGQGISGGNNETVTFTAVRGRRYLLVVDGLGGIVTTSATGEISVTCE